MCEKYKMERALSAVPGASKDGGGPWPLAGPPHISEKNTLEFVKLVAMPFVTSSFLLLVVKPGATSSFLL